MNSLLFSLTILTVWKGDEVFLVSCRALGDERKEGGKKEEIQKPTRLSLKLLVVWAQFLVSGVEPRDFFLPYLFVLPAFGKFGAAVLT